MGPCPIRLKAYQHTGTLTVPEIRLPPVSIGHGFTRLCNNTGGLEPGTRMRYCSLCGGAITRTIPPGDTRERDVCTQCGEVFYENPRMIVGSVPEWDGRLLLCRRAIEPRLGLWTLPAGFLENGETTAEGAGRESREEVGAPVTLGAPLILINLPRIHQIHLFYRARLDDLPEQPGHETLENGLFAEADLPWTELAFPSVRLTLEYYFQKRREGQGFPFYIHDLRIERTLQPVAK